MITLGYKSYMRKSSEELLKCICNNITMGAELRITYSSHRISQFLIKRNLCYRLFII